jgi:hypothetical protein
VREYAIGVEGRNAPLEWGGAAQNRWHAVRCVFPADARIMEVRGLADGLASSHENLPPSIQVYGTENKAVSVLMSLACAEGVFDHVRSPNRSVRPTFAPNVKDSCVGMVSVGG